MMASTLPSSRSGHNIPSCNKEIQTKKDALMTLENALKKRINEFKELCLKEGELTGQLPIDYPLQPREPIPQIRRRIRKIYNNNFNNAINNHTHVSNGLQKNISGPPINFHRAVQSMNCVNNGITSNGTNGSSTVNSLNSISSLPPPARPPRCASIRSSQSDFTDCGAYPKPNISENQIMQMRGYQDKTQLTGSSCSLGIPLQHHNVNGPDNFRPFYEETKPFQMSDLYKYSSKYRQKTADVTKTTRQLQEEFKNNAFRITSCDDEKIQASVKLIEKSDKKLIEATAKAIAVNPELAEKINNILPNKQRF